MTWVTAENLVEIQLSAEQRCKLFERSRERVTVEWFGKKITACFDDPFEAESLRARYRDFLTAGAPDLWTCAARGDCGGPIFFAEPGGAFRYPEALRKPGHVAFVADTVTQRAFFNVNPLVISFHAAAVEVGDAAAAISAMSTGGKTTTAIACARRGMGLYTDERCVIIDGEVYPFPRAINVRWDAIALLTAQAVPGDGDIGLRLRAHAGAEWKMVTFAELLGNRPPPRPRRLEAIFFIEGRGEVPIVAPLPLDAAVARLVSAAFWGPAVGLDRVAGANAIFKHTRAYSLKLGLPDDTAQLLATTTRLTR